MEFTDDALVLRTVNYGENDRMVTLLSARKGKFGAAMKGVRKAGAKLNFAAQPFCFAEFTIADRAGRKTVTSASLHDGFYALRENMKTYYTALCVLEACDRLLPEDQPTGVIVQAVNALKELCSGEPYALLVFLCKILAASGYPLTPGASGEYRRFDFEKGVFSENGTGAQISESTISALRSVLYEEGEITPDGYKRALRFIRVFISYVAGIDLPTLGELLNVL